MSEAFEPYLARRSTNAHLRNEAYQSTTTTMGSPETVPVDCPHYSDAHRVKYRVQTTSYSKSSWSVLESGFRFPTQSATETENDGFVPELCCRIWYYMRTATSFSPCREKPEGCYQEFSLLLLYRLH